MNSRTMPHFSFNFSLKQSLGDDTMYDDNFYNDNAYSYDKIGESKLPRLRSVLLVVECD